MKLYVRKDKFLEKIYGGQEGMSLPGRHEILTEAHARCFLACCENIFNLCRLDRNEEQDKFNYVHAHIIYMGNPNILDFSYDEESRILEVRLREEEPRLKEALERRIKDSSLNLIYTNELFLLNLLKVLKKMGLTDIIPEEAAYVYRIYQKAMQEFADFAELAEEGKMAIVQNVYNQVLKKEEKDVYTYAHTMIAELAKAKLLSRFNKDGRQYIEGVTTRRKIKNHLLEWYGEKESHKDEIMFVTYKDEKVGWKVSMLPNELSSSLVR